jgi:hypothetical protein
MLSVTKSMCVVPVVDEWMSVKYCKNDADRKHAIVNVAMTAMFL